LTATYTCEATGLTVTPDIFVSGPVFMKTVTPGVVQLTKCPTCMGTVTMVVDGNAKEIPVPTEDQVVALHCSGNNVHTYLKYLSAHAYILFISLLLHT